MIVDRTSATGSSGDAAGDTFETIEAFQLMEFDDDRFVGSDDAETVYGGGGNDTLIGNGGDDVLNGEEQDDILTVGAGADTFAFSGWEFGKDIVTAFRSGDLIVFSTPAFSDLSAVQAHLSQVGADAVITLDADDTATFQDVVAASLKAADLHFV